MNAVTPATYLGGDPNVRGGNLDGKLLLDDNEISFDWMMLEGVTTKTGAFTIKHDEILAASLGGTDQMRALTRGAAGVLLGGAIGGLIGMATGKRTTILAVKCRREGFDFIAMFSVTAQDGRVFHDAWQRGRKDAGAAALPTIEAHAGDQVASAVDEQTQLLRRAVGLLEELVALQRR